MAVTPLDAAIGAGDHLTTGHGLLPSPDRQQRQSSDPALNDHERLLLTAVLLGNDDHSSRWGLFRRRIGLRFDQHVPDPLWSDADLALIAAEIDAIFRGQRSVTTT